MGEGQLPASEGRGAMGKRLLPAGEGRQRGASDGSLPPVRRERSEQQGTRGVGNVTHTDVNFLGQTPSFAKKVSMSGTGLKKGTVPVKTGHMVTLVIPQRIGVLLLVKKSHPNCHGYIGVTFKDK